MGQVGKCDRGLGMFCGIFSSAGYYGGGVSYTCNRIAEGMADFGYDTVVHVPWQTRVPMTLAYRPAVSKLAAKFLRQLVKPIQERAFFNEIIASSDPKKFAYMWPDASLKLARALQERGVPMVREMINCHVGTAKTLLDAAYRRRGFGESYLTDRHVAYENAFLALMDRVVVSNDESAHSVMENGVDRARVIKSNYGWEESKIPAGIAPDRDPAAPVFLFVGTLCLRKGIDTLLNAWRDSAIEGKLVLLGVVDPEVASLVAGHLSPRVVHLPYSDDVASVYRHADVFVMPSLEEGGPLVTYEAIGAGLPVIATPMGAGYALRQGENGILVPADDESALTDALKVMAKDIDIRRRFAAASHRIAPEFLWKSVGRRRAQLLHDSLF